ncbi:hypothetical protein B0I32_11541 [Nonomuraea fuscirosea]|uniref:Uncharacterized protein n=1 Tax=Nonomuraea fuscirosea TaxID=1291556 RepID=A0A2T0MRT0_9ACTN|nr:hypothetical protein [Nonomuraea fuscirosea]PRX61187.1 hypothetical protein B0I32_11541 [Nonomuraea fuscirosea]
MIVPIDLPAGGLIRRAGFPSGPARAKLLGGNAEVFLGQVP